MQVGRIRIKMRVCVLVLLLLGNTFNIAVAKSSKKKKKTQIELLTTEKAIAAIDSIYVADSLAETLVYYAASLASMHEILARTDTAETKMCSKIYSHYFDSFFDAQDAEDWQLMKKQATIYTMLGDIKNLAKVHLIYEQLIRLYGAVPDSDGVRFFFRRYGESIKPDDSESIAHLAQLKKEFDEILRETFEDAASGMYVSTETDKHGLPLFMIKLNGVYSPSILRAPEMPELSVLKYKNKDTVNYIMKQRYIPECRWYPSDRPTEMLLFGFHNERYHDGNAYLASALANTGNSVYNTMQEHLRKAPTNSWGDFGRYMQAKLVASTFQAAMMLAKSEAEKSSVKFNRYTFNLRHTSPRTFDATYGHYYQYDNSALQIRKDTLNRSLTLVKWEPNDGVFFCGREKDLYYPMSLLPINKKDDLLNDEDYQHLRSAYKRQMIFGAFSGAFAGLSIFSLGIALGMNPETESQTETQDFMYILGGGMALYAAGFAVPTIIFAKKASKYRRRVNEKNLNLLKSKADITSVSFLPSIDPVNNGGGMSVSINF